MSLKPKDTRTTKELLDHANTQAKAAKEREIHRQRDELKEMAERLAAANAEVDLCKRENARLCEQYRALEAENARLRATVLAAPKGFRFVDEPWEPDHCDTAPCWSAEFGYSERNVSQELPPDYRWIAPEGVPVFELRVLLQRRFEAGQPYIVNSDSIAYLCDKYGGGQ